MAMPPLKHYFLPAKHLMAIVLVLAVALLGIKERTLQSKYIDFMKNFQPKTRGRNSMVTGTLIRYICLQMGSFF